MRSALTAKNIVTPSWALKESGKPFWDLRLRIINFDPSEVYKRADPFIDPYKRNQSKLSTEIMFPKRTDGLCRCGCGEKARKFWANDMCQQFAYTVYQIICYGTNRSSVFVETYYGTKCQFEGCEKEYCDMDHIIPVKHGGGGCWLSNYLPLCKEHHRDKTNKDFGFGKYKTKTQLTIEL